MIKIKIMKNARGYDLFISYAHWDNQPVSEGEKGWISSFHKSLEVRLGQLLGREPHIWRDDKLRGNDEFGDEIKSKLLNTKIFLAVISPFYLQSQWCLEELDEFIKAAVNGSGIYIGNKSRIFKVVKTFVGHEQHPGEIRGLLGYEFFLKDEKGQGREFNPDSKSRFHQEFIDKIEDVAFDICKLIKEMDRENLGAVNLNLRKNKIEHEEETYIKRLCDQIDFNTYIINLINDFEGSELHRLYIEPDFFSERERRVINSFEFVEEWLQNPGRKQLFLLGDYGTGKTSFAKALTYKLGKAYKNAPSQKRIPFLVELSECRGVFRLNILLQKHLEKAKVKSANVKIILSLLAHGRVLLIFDAFDEMAAMNSKEDTLKNFYKLSQIVSGDAKIIFISRTHYFRDKDEEERMLVKQGLDGMSDPAFSLYREISEKPRFEIVYLKEFSETHVREYLKKTMGKEWETAHQKIKSIYNLQDLSSRPVLLDMIVKTLPRIKTETSEFNAVHLYEAYSQIWFERQDQRLHITKEVIEKLVEGLAYRLWNEEKLSIHYSALPGVIREHLKDKIKTNHDLEAADNEMRTASFLVRDNDGNYSFAHESFKQFFIARKIKNELLRNNFDIIDLKLLSKEVVFFFRHLMPNDERTFKLIIKLLEEKYRKRISENALFILYTVLKIVFLKMKFSWKDDIEFSTQDVEAFKELVQDHFPKKLDLRGATLAGWSLSYMLYKEADFTEAFMENSVFRVSTFEGSKFKDTYMKGSDFSGSVFKNVSFTHVKAHHCNFRNCRFVNCTFKCSDFSMSNFMDAIFEFCSIEGNDFTGAGFYRSNFDMKTQENNCYFGAGVPGVETSAFSILWVDQGHEDIIRTAAISRDGRFMVTGSDDKTLKLWDLENGHLIKTLEGHARGVLTVFISPDSRRIVSGGSDHTVKLWDLESGCLIYLLKGHKDWVNSVFISPDNRWIVSGSSDHTLKLWNLESGRLIKTMEGHNRAVLSVFICAGNRRIVSGSSDYTVKLWDMKNGRFIKTLKEENHAVSSVFISPDNRWIACGGYDKRIKLWNLANGELIKILEGHKDWVRTVYISTDNQRLVSGSDDKTVKLWDLKSGRLIKTFEGHGNIVNSVFISPDNRIIVSGGFDKAIKVWDTESGRLVRTLEDHKDSVDFDMTNPVNLARFYYRDRMALYPARELPELMLKDLEKSKTKRLYKP